MTNDFKILITGALDPNKSVSEINKGLEQLQGKIEKLKVSINIDDNVLKTLKDFATQMEGLGKVAENTGKVIQESINPDGSRTKITYYNGVLQEIQDLGAAADKVGKQQLTAAEELTNGWGEATKAVERYNAAQKNTSNTTTFKQGNQTLNVKTNADDQVLSYNISTTNDLKNAQDKLTQSMKKLYDQGVLNEQFFENFNKAIDTAKDVQEVNKLSDSLARVSQYVKNQNSQTSLLGQSQSLLGSDKNVNASGINDLINRLNALNLSEENATRQLSLMQAELNGFQTSATTASEETNTLGSVLGKTFGNIATYFSGYMVIQQMFNAIKDGIGTVNRLNQELTQISIVTYQNQQQVNALGDSYNKLAQQLGVTTLDITNEAAELYRQGLSADQVTQRMQTITEYAKISSLDTKTATEIMTAAINSMGVSAQHASDVWAYLGKQNCPLAS